MFADATKTRIGTLSIRDTRAYHRRTLDDSWVDPDRTRFYRHALCDLRYAVRARVFPRTRVTVSQMFHESRAWDQRVI